MLRLRENHSLTFQFTTKDEKTHVAGDRKSPPEFAALQFTLNEAEELAMTDGCYLAMKDFLNTLLTTIYH
jgi:hypothetical protein